MYTISLAIARLNKNALPLPHGNCAKAVVDAVEAGGLKLPRGHAETFFKTLGDILRPRGFIEIYGGIHACLNAKPGDIAVMYPPNSVKLHGHIAMLNEKKQWVSDGFQPHGVYPNQQYRTVAPELRLFRPSVTITGPTR